MAGVKTLARAWLQIAVAVGLWSYGPLGDAAALVAMVVGAFAGAAAAAALGAAAATVLIGSFTLGNLVSAVTNFAVSSLLGGLLGNDSGGKEDTGSGGAGSFQSEARGRLQVVRSSVAARTIVYGQVMVSGPLVYAEVGGPNNRYLHMVIPLANHEVQEIGDVYFNDVKIPSSSLDASGNVNAGTFSGYARIKKHLGAVGQAADTDLVSESAGKWTAAHRLDGVAYVYVRLDYNQDIFPGGIPNIKALVKGKKLYDPRSATTAWSNNWALVMRDYLVTPASAGGLGALTSEVDDAQVIAAANICDELVTLADATTQARYTADGTVSTDRRPLDIIRDLLSAGAGVLTYPQGVFKLWPGAYTAPSVTLTESDLRGPVELTTRVPRRDLFNAVKGTYSNPDNFWQPSDFPQVSNATYAAQDGGDVIVKDIDLPFTTDDIRAQRIAKINLEKSRQGMTVVLPCNLRQAFGLAMWDTVAVTISQLGWSAKVFRVAKWTLAQDGMGVDLTLREESSASYSWAAGDATVVDPAPDTNLPNPFTVAAPGTPTVTESLYQTVGSAGVKSRATVSWAASADAFVRQYEVQYKAHNDTVWLALPWQSGTTLTLDDTTPGTYDVRVRAINGLGVRSAYSATVTVEILGLTAAPANVSNFSVLKVGGLGIAQWDLSGDLDVRIGGRTVVRWSPDTSVAASWNNAVIFEEFAGDAVSGAIALKTGTYFAKFKDSSGNYSTTAASFVATEGAITGYSTVATVTESPTFAGTKTNTAVVSAALQLDGATPIDSMASLIDTWGLIDSLGGVSATGSYAFAGVMDCTTVATRRFEASIAVSQFDTGDLIDSRTSLIDDWSLFDGSVVDDCDATLYIATTNDDPAGTPTWGPWTPFFVSDFTCRAAKFRLDLTSANTTHNIAVSTLSVSAKQ